MFTRISPAILALTFGVFLPGCVSFTDRGYEEFTKDLDGRSELSVTTYPAGAPNDKTGIPFIYRRAESAEKVFFQVNVRDAKKGFGHNPNIRSIRINSFDYRVGGGPRRHLISGFSGNYWKQDNRIDAPHNPPPAPYVPGGNVTFFTDITLNGKHHKIQGTMPAYESGWFGPLGFYGTGD